MSITLQGEADILRAIEAKLGVSRTTRVVNKALRNAGKRNQEIVKDAVSSYRKTGKTYDLVITSGVKKDPKRVETGWASKERSPIVHLNEFGYTRFGKYVRPQGMGKLQDAADKIGDISMDGVRKDLEDLAK